MKRKMGSNSKEKQKRSTEALKKWKVLNTENKWNGNKSRYFRVIIQQEGLIMTSWYKRADRNSSFSARERDGLCCLLEPQHYLGHWEAGGRVLSLVANAGLWERGWGDDPKYQGTVEHTGWTTMPRASLSQFKFTTCIICHITNYSKANA